MVQGCHYLLDVKFKDFSMTFNDLFKQIQDLYQLKPERFKHFFQNKLCYSALLNWLILTMKNNQWQVTLDKNQALQSHSFCFSAVSNQNYFNLQHIFIIFANKERIFFAYSRIFKSHNPNSRTFQGLEFFPPNSRTFQDFQGRWQPCKPSETGFEKCLGPEFLLPRDISGFVRSVAFSLLSQLWTLPKRTVLYYVIFLVPYKIYSH